MYAVADTAARHPQTPLEARKIYIYSSCRCLRKAQVNISVLRRHVNPTVPFFVLTGDIGAFPERDGTIQIGPGRKKKKSSDEHKNGLAADLDRLSGALSAAQLFKRVMRS